MNNIGKSLSLLKSFGYKKSNDTLGTYFDKNNRKLSCMKHGFNYICYHNINIDNKWNLVNKSGILKDYNEALLWVVQEANKYK
jgi:hypothetical protein